jgi:hypothetical protein
LVPPESFNAFSEEIPLITLFEEFEFALFSCRDSGLPPENARDLK